MRCLLFLFLAVPSWSQQSQVNNGSSSSGGGLTSVSASGDFTGNGTSGSPLGTASTQSTIQDFTKTVTFNSSVTFQGISSYTYTSGGGPVNTGTGYTIVNLSSGSLTVGGLTATVTTMSSTGYIDFPQIAQPSPLVTGQVWSQSDGNFYYTPDGSKVLTVLSSTFTASGGSPGGIVNNVQVNNGSSGFTGITLFNATSSSITISETFQSTGTTIIGKDTGACGALFAVGTAGTRCSQSGNNTTSAPVVIHNNGQVQLGLTDQSDAFENNLGVSSLGAYMGPNISAEPNSIYWGTSNPGIRLGTTGHTTIGLNAPQDAGTNAQLYINNPSTAAVGGTVFSNVSATNTIANTNETVLYTNVIKARTFLNNGDCVILTCGMHGAANTNTKRTRIRFANTTSSSVDGSILDDTGAQAANNTMLAAMARVCKTGSSTQVLAYTEAQGAGVLGGAITNPSLTATDTSDINVSCTCQNGTANSGDCVGNSFTGDYKPAP